MNAEEEDRPTPVPPSSEYPPRNTGRYRIKPLPKPVEVPQAARGTQWEPLAEMMRAGWDRQDAITKEQRYAEAAYRTYYDDRADAQAKVLDELKEDFIRAASLLGELGTAVAALRDIPEIVSKLERSVETLSSQVGQVRRCVRKLERDFRDLRTTVETTSSGQAELTGRVLALEVRYKELWDAIHVLEEELDLRESDDEGSDDDAAESATPDDSSGAGGDAATDDPAGSE